MESSHDERPHTPNKVIPVGQRVLLSGSMNGGGLLTAKDVTLSLLRPARSIRLMAFKSSPEIGDSTAKDSAITVYIDTEKTANTIAHNRSHSRSDWGQRSKHIGTCRGQACTLRVDTIYTFPAEC